MARYTGPVCRLCRRVGEKLMLKGERCFSPRCAVERRRAPPGNQSGRRRRTSEHGLQLKEKQKARYIYGIMEGQFRKYMDQAFQKPGVTGQSLLELLARRFDNAVFRLGFAESRRHARQLVLHGHLAVNGQRMNIPSYLVQQGDIISWKESHKQREFFKELAKDVPRRPVPQWLQLDVHAMSGKALSLPTAQDLETAIETRLIVEYYSR